MIFSDLWLLYLLSPESDLNIQKYYFINVTKRTFIKLFFKNDLSRTLICNIKNTKCETKNIKAMF